MSITLLVEHEPGCLLKRILLGAKDLTSSGWRTLYLCKKKESYDTDGTVYPYSPRREQTPIYTRIVTIADIFEAFTTADHLYKRPKALLIRIMSFIKESYHIDPDLFDLFLLSDVYKKYTRTIFAERVD